MIDKYDNLIKRSCEDISKRFGIKDGSLYRIVVSEVYPDKFLNMVSTNRDVDNWRVDFPLGGPGTVLNGCVIYSLIRFFESKSILETGVSGGVYTSFILCAAIKNQSEVISLEISDNQNEVAKLVPDHYKKYERWSLILGRSSLDFLAKTDKSFDLYSHDSLHTLSHMTKEFTYFKKSKKDSFIVYIDDQNSDNFWDFMLSKKMYKKQNFSTKMIDGNSSSLGGHLGGFLLYEKNCVHDRL